MCNRRDSADPQVNTARACHAVCVMPELPPIEGAGRDATRQLPHQDPALESNGAFPAGVVYQAGGRTLRITEGPRVQAAGPAQSAIRE